MLRSRSTANEIARIGETTYILLRVFGEAVESATGSMAETRRYRLNGRPGVPWECVPRLPNPSRTCAPFKVVILDPASSGPESPQLFPLGSSRSTRAKVRPPVEVGQCEAHAELSENPDSGAVRRRNGYCWW